MQQQKEKLHRTMMYAAGNNAALLRDAPIYGADAVIYDVEDSVSVHEKDSARQLVFHALKYLPRTSEIGIRINHPSTPWFKDDLEALIPAKPDFVRLPKGETAEEIQEVDAILTRIEMECGFDPGCVKIMVAL